MKVFVSTLTYNMYPWSACVIEGIRRCYDRDKIVLCVSDNGSTDRMVDYHGKHHKEYDIFLQNGRNIGICFAQNRMLMEFKKSDCEWMIFHEGDSVPVSPCPATTLMHLWNRLQREMGNGAPKVIGFGRPVLPAYPLEQLYSDMNIGKQLSRAADLPIIVSNEPLKHVFEYGLKFRDRLSDSVTAAYISSSTLKGYPPWMTICVHQSVWDALGYFDESDQGCDLDFYWRLQFTDCEVGYSDILQILKHDFQPSWSYLLDARIKLIDLCGINNQRCKCNQSAASNGFIYRSSIYDDYSLNVWNPLIGEKTYGEYARENLEWIETNCQLDASVKPTWMERIKPNDPRIDKYPYRRDGISYREWEPHLIGQLEFVGDYETAELVRKGDL